MTFQAQTQQSINHFSHPHTLHLSNIPNNPLLHQSFSCSGCKLNATRGLIYTCTCCNYFLHIKCSQMPQQITHPFHKDHVFTLVPIPQYQAGYFNCDACGKLGQGFSYHCKSCSLDLHIYCASMPLSIIHQSHFHTLDLVFSPPYVDKVFNCDICHTLGNHWLYRCQICDFDAHLDCARNDELNMEHIISNQFQQPCMVSRSAPQTFFQPISMIQESATGIPIQQFVNNQGVQGPLGVNWVPQINSTEYMSVQQMLARQESYNQNYMPAACGNGGGGFGGIGRGGNGGVQLLIQALTGLPVDAGSLNLLKSLVGGRGKGLPGGGSGGGLDALGGDGDFQQGDYLGGLNGY